MSESSAGRLGQERWKGIPGKTNSTCKGTEASEYRLNDMAGVWGAWERVVHVSLEGVQERINSASLQCSNPAHSKGKTGP